MSAPRRSAPHHACRKYAWETKKIGGPFTYTVGIGTNHSRLAGVVVGWEQGCLGMRVGEIRHISIPADEAYGPRGLQSRGIPADAALELELEVLDIGGGPGGARRGPSLAQEL